MNKTELLIEASNLLSKIEDRIEQSHRDLVLCDYSYDPAKHFVRAEEKAIITELKNILSSKEAQRIIKEIKK